MEGILAAILGVVVWAIILTVIRLSDLNFRQALELNNKDMELASLTATYNQLEVNYQELKEKKNKFIYELKTIPRDTVYKREIDLIAEEMGVRVDEK